MRYLSVPLWLLLLGLLAAGCDSNPADGDADPTAITTLRLTPNPSGYAPLTAEAALTANRPVQVELIVGEPGTAGAVQHRFPGVSPTHTLPILGLYPDSTNSITLRLYSADGTFLADSVRTVTTPPLLTDLPAVTIDAARPSAMKPGMNLVSYFGHDSGVTPQRAFIFDAEGAIRWYLDLRTHPTLGQLFYDNGVERLANGNLYFGDRNSGRIIEMDMLGRIVRAWPLPGYRFHHNVIEKPDGNFLVTVDKEGAPTVEDYLIEIDRASGAIVREWNLNESLDNTRRAWPTDLADLNVDWFHANAVTYDPRDETIIVSGRTQGTVKLTADNEVVWILAPHIGWETAGDGSDLATRLLQPLDGTGTPITDADVLTGRASHPDFEWAWYQHAPELLPNGDLLLFDNGDNRHYRGSPAYSRAVIYRIDDEARTIQQTWEYGKERGLETYSRIVSDVDYHADEGTVVFMPGAVTSGGAPHGKVVEVEQATRTVVFEATIMPPVAPFGITFHRVERLPLYPPSR